MTGRESPNPKLNMKDTVMKAKNNIHRTISLLISGLALALVFTVWSGAAQAADEKHEQHSRHMNQIKTQAEAEALKPGDSISMVCSKCKNVMFHDVTNDDAHVKMMTVGQKHTCPDCGGAVDVVGTGKGTGKNEEVKHVCSKCGDDAMFICASKPGSGAMKDMEKEKK